MKTLEERFWAKVRKTDGCWEWTGSKAPSGHGSLCVQTRRNIGEPRRHEGAHRVAWRLLRGPIPDGLCVLHKCDNPPCVNPDHLFLGTQLENVQDRERKGRSAPGSIRASRGENNGQSKLTAQDVARMRKMYRVCAASTCLLSDLFCISRRQIAKIVHGEGWAHLANDYRAPFGSHADYDLARDIQELQG